MSTLILQGLLIGFSLAAPVGPMAMLCIQRTLSQGLLFGLVSGLGIAIADVVYGLIAALGLTAVSEFLTSYQRFLTLAGGSFIIWLGISAIRTSSSTTHLTSTKRTNMLRSFSSALFLTFSNPMTILAYVAIFSSASINLDGSHVAALIIISAIFVGSFAWWILLCGVVAASKHKLTPSHVRWINIISGFILIGFGVYLYAKTIGLA